MLFPTNDANWALDITPKPDIPDSMIPPPPPSLATDEQGQQVEQPAQPYTPDQVWEIKRAIARKACTGMSETIKDQFGESHYDEHGRNIIFDACLYGTGVLRGPILKNKKRHTFQAKSGYDVKMVKSAKPSVEHVDIWSFFPQPSRSIDECEHVFRLSILPRRGVRQLASQPGFDKKQVARLLGMQPQHGALVTGALGSIRPDAQVVLSDRYSVWEYRGPMPKDAFAAFVSGMVNQGDLTADDAADVLAEMQKDELHEIDCEVWMSQGVVIKMALSTLPPGELGYYVYNYEKDPNSIFGKGVAYLCRDDQTATNQLWHAMMLNSMMSAGPQIGVRKSSVIPQGTDGRASTFAADRPRVWALNDDVADIKQVFSVFVIPNVTDKIMGMYERAKQNAVEHTMTPLIAQGEPTSAVPTSSGTAMLMNAANVVMRRLAKGYDDDITIPLLDSFYDWNMVNSDDDSIRGDYCVIARGSSHLLIKDVMTQHLQFATQLFTSNPVLAPYMKAKVFADKNIEMLDMSPADMLYTDEQVAEQQKAKGEQPDPELMKAQAAQAVAEAQKVKAETEQAIAADKMEWQREERKYANQERMADINGRIAIQTMQLEGARWSVLQSMAQMESDERQGFAKIVADLEKHGATVDLGQYTADTKARVEVEKIVSNEAKVDKEIKAEKSSDAKVQ